MILFFMHLFSKMFHIKEDVSEANRENNRKFHVPTTGDGYIDWQEQMKSFRYGKQSDFLSDLLLGGEPLNASINGCGLIAVYNVLAYYGIKRSFSDIVYDFEKNGASLFGYFGSSFNRIAGYIKKEGLQVSDVPVSYAKGDTVRFQTGERVSYIITGLNEKGRIRSMVHTIALTCEGNLLRAHNDVTGGRLYSSLAEAVYDFGNGKGAVLKVIMIRGKEDEQDRDSNLQLQ